MHLISGLRQWHKRSKQSLSTHLTGFLLESIQSYLRSHLNEGLTFGVLPGKCSI